jgi:hypothetical protein
VEILSSLLLRADVIIELFCWTLSRHLGCDSGQIKTVCAHRLIATGGFD